MRRRVENHLLRPKKDAGPIRPTHQGIEHRQLMIQPPTQESDTQHDRCPDTAQGLVEIGAVLFADREQPLGRNLRTVAACERIEVADHRIRNPPRIDQSRRATVSRHSQRGAFQCLLHVVGAGLSTTKQGNWPLRMDNFAIFSKIDHFSRFWTYSDHKMIG
ncbi:hypothetical protein SL1157_2337 [Ruegeria lacuscaerulensis ITI-1157]|nr:hypothetical protein SL1157_2337 [Ruegeria lacuscaerulensis ITI-1157]